MKTTFAVLDKNGDNALDRILDVLSSLGSGNALHTGLVTPVKSVLEKSPGILRRQGLNSSATAAYCSSKPPSSGYEFLQLDEAAVVFEGKLYSPVSKDALQQRLNGSPQHCESSLQTLLETADGDYCFFMVKDGSIAAARDPVGVQPLYYGETQDIAAFATNRSVLWRLGIKDPVSFPPGNLAVATKNGFQFKPVKTLPFTEPEPITLESAADTLQVLLEESIKRRTRDVKEAAVAFSGGLDSSVVAYLASKLGVKVSLLHVSMENEPETEEAVDISCELNLPMQVHFFKDSDVEATLPKVVELIEEADPIKASIGLPFYWTAERAAEAGYNVVLAGQGADELFGGYQRYVNEYCKEGSAKVRKTMYNDVVNIHISNLERDLKVTGYHDVELRMPFASFDIAEFALKLPVECKIEPKADTLRKLVLRKVALNVGMPRSVVDKPKKAVQYSTGINDAVKRVAKKHGKTVSDYIEGLFRQSDAKY